MWGNPRVSVRLASRCLLYSTHTHTHIHKSYREERKWCVCVCFYLRFIIRTYRVSFLLFYHFTTSTFPGPIHTDTQTVPSLSCLNSKPGKTDLTSRLTAKNGGRLLKGKRSVVGTGQTCLFGFFFRDGHWENWTTLSGTVGTWKVTVELTWLSFVSLLMKRNKGMCTVKKKLVIIL